MALWLCRATMATGLEVLAGLDLYAQPALMYELLAMRPVSVCPTAGPCSSLVAAYARLSYSRAALSPTGALQPRFLRRSLQYDAAASCGGQGQAEVAQEDG